MPKWKWKTELSIDMHRHNLGVFFFFFFPVVELVSNCTYGFSFKVYTARNIVL